MKKKSYLLICLLAGLVSGVAMGLILPPFPHAKKQATRIQAVNNSARPTAEWFRTMWNLPAENKPTAPPK